MSAWARVSLESIAESVDYGVTASAVRSQVGPKFLRITDIQDDYVDWGSVPWCDCDSRTLESSRLRAGDIVFARTGATTGKSYLIGECPPDAVFASYLIRVRVGHGVDSRYVSHFFKSKDYWAQITKAVRGVAQPGVNATTLKSLEIPLPSLSEQRHIGAILDKANALRTKRRQALAQLDGVAQSMFVEMFGDPGANPKGWPLVTLGRLIRDKPNNGIFRKNEEYGDGLPVAWVEELFRGHSVDLENSRRVPATQDEIRKYGLKRGDILFCRSSLKLAGLGYNNVYLGPDDAALFECHVIRISPRPDVVDSEFLNFLLRIPSQRQRLFRFAKTVTMSTIDQEGLKNIEVPVPPRELQESFVERLHAIQKNRTQMLDSTGTLDKLFESLQQQVFGK